MNLKKIILKQPSILNLFKLGGVKSPQPLFLLIHLTLACNLNCPDCYQSSDDFYKPFQKKFIKPDDFEKILSQAQEFWFRPRIHFFGGEPLLHPDFATLLGLADNAGYRSSITTNGILLEKYIPQIAGSRLNQINISFSFDGQPTAEKTNQWKKIEKAVANLRRNTKKSLKINLNCVIGETNHQRLTDIAKKTADSRLPIDALVFQHPYFNPSTPPQIDLAALISQIKNLKKAKTDFEIFFIPNIKKDDLAFFYDQTKKGAFKKNCLMPWLGLNILPNLLVTPGGGVLGCNRVIGDLSQESLKNIWNNQLTKNFRQMIINQRLPAACARCCHRRYY